jgi:kynureninase
MLTRADAVALDAADPLARYRADFVIPDPSLVYLDGNSLGRTPRRTLARLGSLAGEEWAGRLIGGWDDWLSLPSRVGDALAPLIGAHTGEVVVHDSTSVNLFQLVHAAAALRTGRRVVAVADDEFPSDRYVVAGAAQALGLDVRRLRDGIRLGDVAVIVRSLVDYRTGEAADLAGFTAAARDAGAIVIWDLCHAVGAIEVDLHAAGVQMAVGCTYKFLNGGPGAPAFSFVDHSLHAKLQQPIHGWFSHRDQFETDSPYAPHLDARRLLIGTPPVLSLVGAEEGIALTAHAGMAAVAAKTTALTQFGLALCDQAGLMSPTPRDAARRGGHVAVVHRDARALVPRLAAEAHVVADFRPPDIVRLGCSALTTRFTDVYDGIDALMNLAASA